MLCPPLIACRLVALDMNPGVQPTGLGTARCIMAKAVLIIIRGDIQNAAGALQLCRGQILGMEAAVHAVQESVQQDDTESVLLVDASNGFNSLNWQVAVEHIIRNCPSQSTILVNSLDSQQSSLWMVTWSTPLKVQSHQLCPCLPCNPFLYQKTE